MESKRSLEQRLTDMESSIASLRMSGFEFTPEEIEELYQVALGKKTSGQYRQELFDKIAQLKVTNPELFIGEDSSEGVCKGF